MQIWRSSSYISLQFITKLNISVIILPVNFATFLNASTSMVTLKNVGINYDWLNGEHGNSFHCKNMSRSLVVKYQNSVPASNEFPNEHLPYAEQNGYPLYNFMYNVRPNRLLAQFTLNRLTKRTLTHAPPNTIPPTLRIVRFSTLPLYNKVRENFDNLPDREAVTLYIIRNVRPARSQ